jgi:hypothetical protein
VIQVAGILAGVFIWWGGKKTRRHEQVEQRLRAALAMEKPTTAANDPETSDRPILASQGRLRDVEGGTESSSPTLHSQEPPRRKDFANVIVEESEVSLDGKGSSEWSEKTRPPQPTAPSFGSIQVPIADHMTVPAPEVVDEYGRNGNS